MAEASGESSMANTVSPTPEPQGFEPEGKEPQGKEPTPGVGPTPTFQRSQTQAESKQFYESLQHVRFQSLDDDAYYLKAEQYLSRHDATNFIVDYGSDVAYATWDLKLDRNVLGPNGKMKLTRESKHRLLDLERVRPPKILTRWIAIFNASDQVDLVHTLIEKYDLSPRHQKLLVSPPPIPHNYRPTERDLAAAKASAEKGRKGVKGGYLEIPNRVYHWHAVEMGGKYIAIGYNSLFSPPEEKRGGQHHSSIHEAYRQTKKPLQFKDDMPSPYPHGIRLWTWLILTDDGTVISIHEPIHRGLDPRYADEELYHKHISHTRDNLLAILRNLSICKASEDSDLRAKQKGLAAQMQEFPFRSSKLNNKLDYLAGPALMFYYLFDDWGSTFQLAVEKQHPYAKKLAEIRSQLFYKPRLTDINQLHHLSRQLTMLTRMYKAYGVIIDKILTKHENAQFTKNMDSENAKEPEVVDGKIGKENVIGVPLHSEANKRFERLKDRIELYALGEIEDCIAEQRELVDLTLNLISFRQQSSVDNLSRAALLFAKATIFFLPVTLVVAYFSTNVIGIERTYTEKNFWWSSGVTLFATVLFLIAMSYKDVFVLWVKERWSENFAALKGIQGPGDDGESGGVYPSGYGKSKSRSSTLIRTLG